MVRWVRFITWSRLDTWQYGRLADYSSERLEFSRGRREQSQSTIRCIDWIPYSTPTVASRVRLASLPCPCPVGRSRIRQVAGLSDHQETVRIGRRGDDLKEYGKRESSVGQIHYLLFQTTTTCRLNSKFLLKTVKQCLDIRQKDFKEVIQLFLYNNSLGAVLCTG